MKIYLAARFRKRKIIEKLKKQLEKMGHKVISEWQTDEYIQPYEEHRKLARKYALRDVEIIKNSDIFVLITDKSGTGMYAEFGMALMFSTINKKPKIYVLGKHLSGAIYFFHPLITRIDNIQKLKKLLN